MVSEAHTQAAYCNLVEDVVRSCGKVQLKVAGTSMVPALWPGDMVLVRRCNPEELRQNSIVVFRQKERLVVHRLMHWAEDCIVARGDARPRYDEPVKACEVLGCVESVLRNGRPVSMRQSFWQDAVAAVLRRSDWWTQLYLRVNSRLRRRGIPGVTFGY